MGGFFFFFLRRHDWLHPAVCLQSHNHTAAPETEKKRRVCDSSNGKRCVMEKRAGELMKRVLRWHFQSDVWSTVTFTVVREGASVCHGGAAAWTGLRCAAGQWCTRGRGFSYPLSWSEGFVPKCRTLKFKKREKLMNSETPNSASNILS